MLKSIEMKWKSRKRNTIGLPWTFTKYALSDDRLWVEKGIFKTTNDEIRLYRILDIRLERTFIQRLFRVGTIKIKSSDRYLGDFELINVKNPDDIKELLSTLVEEQRTLKRVTSREFMNADFNHDDCDEETDENSDSDI